MAKTKLLLMVRVEKGVDSASPFFGVEPQMFSLRTIFSKASVSLLVAIAFGLNVYLCQLLYSAYPTAVVRILSILFAVGLLATGFYMGWRIWRAGRIKMRTLVFLVPILIGVLCLPARQLIESQSMRHRLSNAGIYSYALEPSGQLAFHLDHWSRIFLGSVGESLWATRLRSIEINVKTLRSEQLHLIRVPSDLERLSIFTRTDQDGLPPEMLPWLRTITSKTQLMIWFGNINETTMRHLAQLECKFEKISVFDQTLDSTQAAFIFGSRTRGLALCDITFAADIDLAALSANNVDYLYVGNRPGAPSSPPLSGNQTVQIAMLTNPRLLAIQSLDTSLSSTEFARIAALPRLEILEFWFSPTFAQLKQLAPQKNLKHLKFECSKISAPEVAELIALLPQACKFEMVKRRSR